MTEENEQRKRTEENMQQTQNHKTRNSHNINKYSKITLMKHSSNTEME